MGLTIGFFHAYLITVPGLIRSGIVFLGILCFIYESIGYDDDFTHVEQHKRHDVLRGYGLGYKQEITNEFFMVAIIICWFFSFATLIALLTIKQAAEQKNINRFLHLGFGIFLMLAWICGIAGTFAFRTNCCHVTNGLKYHNSSRRGYSNRCSCSLTVKWRPECVKREGTIEEVVYTDYWDPTIYFCSKQILSAYPHDFEAHCLAHGSVFVMAFMYLLSFILV